MVCICMVWRDARRRKRTPAGALTGLKFWRSEPKDYHVAFSMARTMPTRHTIVWLERPGFPATHLKGER